MKSKTILAIAFVAIMALSLIVPANAANFPNLPNDPVGLTLTIQDAYSWPGTATLSDVEAGYDVHNIGYPAFCAELDEDISKDTLYQVTLISSLTLGATWQKINYLLNNYVLDLDLQIAIWIVLGYDPVNADPDHSYIVTGAIQAMVDDANANYGSFTVAPGSHVAVKCEQEDDNQDLLIVLTFGCFEGLTPGFWKNHPDVWQGYTEDQIFDSVFGVDITINAGKKTENTNPSLMDALNANGGINENKGVYDALIRHAVAAILNAENPYINYPMTSDEIIQAVGTAINNGVGVLDAESLKNQLESYNQLGGGIDAHGNPI